MNKMYDTLRHYGEIIADKNHETTEGNFIRFTTYKYNNIYYIVIMCNGILVAISETNDVHNLVEQEETTMSEWEKTYYAYKLAKYKYLSQLSIDKK